MLYDICALMAALSRLRVARVVELGHPVSAKTIHNQRITKNNNGHVFDDDDDTVAMLRTLRRINPRDSASPGSSSSAILWRQRT